ncbi:hypothetical protein [uncultured Lacinutrix sp.]|uniref:hypothetical protein n=1 Tax=uncultured Lacinutrix sp. TaxID=574032 RepID=UPI00260EBC2D|nr:hypothetical protein [uncultured Lacinutrix sp.]
MKNLILTFFLLIISLSIYSQNSNSLLDSKTATIIEKAIKKHNTNIVLANSSLNCNLKSVNINTMQINNSSVSKIKNNTKDFFRKFFGRNPIHLTSIDLSKNNYSIFPGENANV